jgi:hypothetical protein
MNMKDVPKNYWSCLKNITQILCSVYQWTEAMFLKTTEEYSFAVRNSADNDMLGLKWNNGIDNLVLRPNNWNLCDCNQFEAL